MPSSGATSSIVLDATSAEPRRRRVRRADGASICSASPGSRPLHAPLRWSWPRRSRGARPPCSPRRPTSASFFLVSALLRLRRLLGRRAQAGAAVWAAAIDDASFLSASLPDAPAASGASLALAEAVFEIDSALLPGSNGARRARGRVGGPLGLALVGGGRRLHVVRRARRILASCSRASRRGAGLLRQVVRRRRVAGRVRERLDGLDSCDVLGLGGHLVGDARDLIGHRVRDRGRGRGHRQHLAELRPHAPPTAASPAASARLFEAAAHRPERGPSSATAAMPSSGASLSMVLPPRAPGPRRRCGRPTPPSRASSSRQVGAELAGRLHRLRGRVADLRRRLVRPRRRPPRASACSPALPPLFATFFDAAPRLAAVVWAAASADASFLIASWLALAHDAGASPAPALAALALASAFPSGAPFLRRLHRGVGERLRLDLVHGRLDDDVVERHLRRGRIAVDRHARRTEGGGEIRDRRAAVGGGVASSPTASAMVPSAPRRSGRDGASPSEAPLRRSRRRRPCQVVLEPVLAAADGARARERRRRVGDVGRRDVRAHDSRADRRHTARPVVGIHRLAGDVRDARRPPRAPRRRRLRLLGRLFVPAPARRSARLSWPPRWRAGPRTARRRPRRRRGRRRRRPRRPGSRATRSKRRRRWPAR